MVVKEGFRKMVDCVVTGLKALRSLVGCHKELKEVRIGLSGNGQKTSLALVGDSHKIVYN